MQADAVIGRERGKEHKEIGEESMDVQAVSLLVPMWFFNVSILELASDSRIPVVGQSTSPEVVAKAISYISRNWNCWHLQCAYKETVSI